MSDYISHEHSAPTVEETLQEDLRRAYKDLDELLDYIHYGREYENRFNATERIRLLKKHRRLPNDI